MSLRLTLCSEVKPIGGAEAKASVNSAIQLHEVDPKLSDLSMARLNLR